MSRRKLPLDNNLFFLGNEVQLKKLPKRTRLFPFLVLALSLLFTVAATSYLASVNRTKNLARFTNATLETENTIRDSLNTYTALLRGGAGLFAASDTVNPQEFHTYFQRLRSEHFYRSLGGFGFAKRVLPDEKETVIKEMRSSGQTNFTIWPDGARAVYFPVLYLEPPSPRNQLALGFDMFSEPIRRAAMLQAAEHGIAFSGKVVLVQDSHGASQPGFLIYTAIYSGRDFPLTDEQRSDTLAGFVHCPFQAQNFFSTIFDGPRKLSTHLQVYDGTEVSEEHLLHSSEMPASQKPRFTIVNRFPVAGRTWTLVHQTTPEFERMLERSNVLWVLVAGFVVSFILFALTLVLSKARQRAEKSESDLLVERERLSASEELHRTIAETAADAIITIDEQSKIMTVNRAAERIFGYKPEEMLGHELTMLMPENMREKHRAGIIHFIQTGEKRIPWGGIELPGWHKRGHSIPLEISFGEMTKRGKRIFTGIIRDITERKKAQEKIQSFNRDLERRVSLRTSELQEANAQMEAFVYSIAHDLRAPLRAMRGFAQALSEDYALALDAAGNDYAARIISSAKFMDELINDLLNFSRITRTHLELTPVNLGNVLLQAREQLAEDIEKLNAVIEHPPSLPAVIAHEATLRQILLNLLSNSLKFVAPGVVPHIVVRLEDSGPNWRLWIEDNGIGVNPEYRDRIFGIFERLHGGAYPGTGIGLAIVRKGIERMNGTVGLESEFGHGSRFWFDLPKAS